MERIDVLVRTNGVDYRFFIQMLRQRQLNEQTGNRIVCVELFNKCNQLFLRGAFRKRKLTRFDADFAAVADFACNVNLTCRIFADDDYGETRVNAVCLELLCFYRQIFLYFFGKCLSVHNDCHFLFLLYWCIYFVPVVPGSF